MAHQYITYNHDDKKFYMSNSVFNLMTKEAKKQVAELLKLEDYVGTITAYGGTYTVKKVSEINNTPFYIPDASYISHELLTFVKYCFYANNLTFSPTVVKCFFDILIKNYYNEFLEIPFNLFTFDKENNQYVNKNLQDFLEKNGSHYFFDVEEINYIDKLGLLNQNIKIKNHADKLIQYLKNNCKVIDDIVKLSKETKA